MNRFDLTEALHDRFERIIVYESQGFRRCGTKKLEALKTANARLRHCASATICHDPLRDVRGLLDFLKRPEFSATFDRIPCRTGRPSGLIDVAYRQNIREMGLFAPQDLDEQMEAAINANSDADKAIYRLCATAPQTTTRQTTCALSAGPFCWRSTAQERLAWICSPVLARADICTARRRIRTGMS